MVSLLLLLHVSTYNFALIREFTHQAAKFYILWVLLGVQNYNFACCFVWVWNLVAHIQGNTTRGVFENRVLRRIFGPKRDEVTREGWTLHNEELNDMYCSPNIVPELNSRITRCVGRVTRNGEMRGVCSFWWGNLRERDQLEVRGVDGRIILWWILGWDVGVWTGSSWLRTGIGGGHFWMR